MSGLVCEPGESWLIILISNGGRFIVLTERPLVAENAHCGPKAISFFYLLPRSLYHYRVIRSFPCPSVWCFFLDSLSAKVLSAVGLLLCFLAADVFMYALRWESKCLFGMPLSLLKHLPPFLIFFAVALSLFTVYPSISTLSLSSHSIFSICLVPNFSFSLAHCSPPSTLPGLSLYFPHYPPFLHPTLSLTPSSLSLPFFAQDRSALITLMALMIQLNGALSPQCLSKAFPCSLLMQQHSAAIESHRSFSVGTNDRMAPASQPCDLLMLSHRSRGDDWTDPCFIQQGRSRCGCCRCAEIGLNTEL